jgi:hypothetical protein
VHGPITLTRVQCSVRLSSTRDARGSPTPPNLTKQRDCTSRCRSDLLTSAFAPEDVESSVGRHIRAMIAQKYRWPTFCARVNGQATKDGEHFINQRSPVLDATLTWATDISSLS